MRIDEKKTFRFECKQRTTKIIVEVSLFHSLFVTQVQSTGSLKQLAVSFLKTKNNHNMRIIYSRIKIQKKLDRLVKTKLLIGKLCECFFRRKLK